jgi:hypothetical protein
VIITGITQLIVGFAVAATLASNATAQETLSKPTIQVMLLGSYHMSNPGLDQINPEADDPRSPKRQREIEAMLAALAEFRPNKIAVERAFSMQDTVAARYLRYLAGDFELGRSEVYQIGFRLAGQLGHETVYAVDYRMGMPMDSAMIYAQAHGQTETLAYLGQQGQAIEKYLNDLILTLTIPEILYHHNDMRGDTLWSGYMTMAMIGGGDDYPGAVAVARYYERNLRIFANITRIAEPGDRILVLFGSGHRVPLHHYFHYAADYELVSPLEYLERAADALR